MELSMGLSEPDVEAAEQLVQINEEDELFEGRCGERKVEIDGPDAVVTVKEGRRKRDKDGDGIQKSRKEKELGGDVERSRKKFRSIAYIYSITRPISQSLVK